MFGYCCVTLQKNKNKRHAFVHSLVSEVYLGEKPNGKYVNHKDGNKLNNEIENLEYITQSENIKHAIKMGLIKPVKGEQHASAKLSESDVLFIRSQDEKPLRMLAMKFNVCDATISMIRNRITWKHI